MRALVVAGLCAFSIAALTIPAQAGHRHVHHVRHGYVHVRVASAEADGQFQFGFGFNLFAPPKASPPSSYRPMFHGGGLTSIRVADGQRITVAAAYADRFLNFFAALYRREGYLPPIHCYSPTGHMAGSLHHWGGACDVGQTARNIAARMMYHVGDLAAQFGLTDGCVWLHPDCGHVDVSGIGGSYARRRHTRYAGA